MDDEEFGEMEPIPSRKFRLIYFVIAIVDAFSSLVDDTLNLLCAHANWRNDRTRFADQARLEIERMVSGE